VAAFRENDLDTVRSAAEALACVDEYEPHLHLIEGMILLRRDRLIEAIDRFGYARDHADTRALAYALSGEALYKARLFRDVERILTTALKLDPSLTDARRWLAAYYYDVGAMNHTVDQLQVVAEQAADDPRPHRLMGLVYKDFEEYKKAIHHYRESLRIAPDQPGRLELLVELAECLVKERRHDEGLKALASCPRSAHVLWLQAECHYARGDGPGARRLLGEALKLAPGQLDASQLLATMDLESGDAASAVEILRRAVEHHPKEYRVRYQLSQAYQRLGEEELAQEQIEAMKNLRTLRERFTKLHEQAIADPADVETRYELGVVAARLDKPELAHGWFTMTLAMDPNHAGAREALEAMVREPPPPGEKTEPMRVDQATARE
jgi:tetratricopeptide (TPR) repeat protein